MALFSTGYKEYSKHVDYLSISNLQELKQARKDLDYKIMHKETELNFMYREIKEILNPANYINHLIMKFASIENIVRCFCKGFNVVKDMIRQYREYPTDYQQDINNTDKTTT